LADEIKTARPAIGHADRLRPASTVTSSAVGMVFALLFGVGLATDLDLRDILLYVTMIVAWLSVALGGVKLAACAMPRPAMPDLLPDEALPDYTVILPLFREAHMVEGLMAAMNGIDYPRGRLDIVMVCEAEDTDTIAAARAASGGSVRVLVVPDGPADGPPQTKPRALNHVLRRSHGTLVTIFDAEDRPHPQQLRQAASAFAAHPDWDALQAPLDYFNTRDTALAAQFGLEYASLFHVLLPFYQRLGLPFPLGGTSNHMRRSALDAAGGWDPHNVTEDADLAFRLAAQGKRRGGRIGWIDSPTQEEAVARLSPWMRQRSRWLKGFLQTWLVHMNSPLAGGWRRALMLQLTLGASLLSIFFFAPVVVLLGLLLLANGLGVTSASVPGVYLVTLGISLLCGMAVGALGAVRAGKPHLLRHVPFMPVYWLLMFPPLLQAIAELRTRPFHWHKTEHGVTGAPPSLTPDTPPPWTHSSTSS
jgi:cellulose synthase/poly-beta-1,6-N-acetylglucosamine synthase-like glycosyltransferase